MLNAANATVRVHEVYIFMLCCLSPRRMHWIRSDPSTLRRCSPLPRPKDPSTLRRCNPLPRPKPQPLDAPASQNRAVSLRSWNTRLQILGGDVQLRLPNNWLTGFKLLSPALAIVTAEDQRLSKQERAQKPLVKVRLPQVMFLAPEPLLISLVWYRTE